VGTDSLATSVLAGNWRIFEKLDAMLRRQKSLLGVGREEMVEGAVRNVERSFNKVDEAVGERLKSVVVPFVVATLV
jgi:hypothetical protein